MYFYFLAAILNTESCLKMGELKIRIEDWGVNVPIRQALEKQDDYWAECVYGNVPGRLIFAEHEPVYTAGLRAGQNLELLQKCFDKPVWDLPCACVVTARGGLATYQGSGILSVYCVFKIQNFCPQQFNNLLLSSAEEALKSFGITLHRKNKNPGLYVGKNKKMVSLGLKYSRGVTRFGMAISLDPDEKYLEPLIPCGIENMRLTSLRDEIGRELAGIERATIKAILSEQIAKMLNS